ncbi:MAG: hypothetical protein EPN93_20705 [Spirochaetes bacterium]|nr:MAG: hypothetical protein EPN93_20705 [Spirochaetota bacterium]
MNRTLLALLAVLLGAFPGAPLAALPVKTVTLTGNTVDLGGEFAARIARIGGDLSPKEIEAIGVMVTDEYHRKGYTASFVEKLALTRAGTLEVSVHESRITEIDISGNAARARERAGAMLAPLRGGVYNRFEVETALEGMRAALDLPGVECTPRNAGPGGGDVRLEVALGARTSGRFRGALYADPIYGVSPMLGYLHVFGWGILDLRAGAAFREGGASREEGEAVYSTPGAGEGRAYFFTGARGARSVEVWAGRDELEYRITDARGYAGAGVPLGAIGRARAALKIYVRGDSARVEDYRAHALDARDIRLTGELSVSDTEVVLERRDATTFTMKLEPGTGTLSERGYIGASASFRAPLAPAYWLRIIPGFQCDYTTARERYYWTYVFDASMMGFPGDYTASRWKNAGSLEAEAELYPDFLYAGPFVNAAYFLDESGHWCSATGAGARVLLVSGKSRASFAWAWNVAGPASKGALYVSAQAAF